MEESGYFLVDYSYIDVCSSTYILCLEIEIVSEGEFSWLKSMQLVVIWEFSSAVSPTSVGGSAVAFFLLSQEKLSAARTIAIVIYTMVIDTLFFVISLPLLYLLLGPLEIIRPSMESLSDFDGYGITFVTVLLFMIAYGLVFLWIFSSIPCY